MKYQQAIDKFDEENSQDPNKETFEDSEYPKELLYAERMTEQLLKFQPKANEALQLAARSQHICRWTKPRDEYPMDRKGYLLWRTELKGFHAEKAGTILNECGYDQQTIDHVQSLIKKEKMKLDADSQLLEDVVCLVFLEHYFKEFASKHEEEKVVEILQKTWRKMSDNGQRAALNLQLSDSTSRIIKRALEG